MTGPCNATLNTHTVTECGCLCTHEDSACGCYHRPGHLEGTQTHVNLYALTCGYVRWAHHPDSHRSATGEQWDDYTKGATPHVEPVPEPAVTDEMVDAARASGPQIMCEVSNVGIQVMLEAALRAQQKENNNE